MDIPIELFLGFIGVSIALAIFGFLRNPQIPATIVMGGMFLLVISVATTNIIMTYSVLDTVTFQSTPYDVISFTGTFNLNAIQRSIIAEYPSTSSSQLIGDTFDCISIPLTKTGNPPIGELVTIGVFNSVGDNVKVFGTINVTNISTVVFWYDFCLADGDSYTIGSLPSLSERIGVKYNAGNSTNTVVVRADTSDPFDSTITFRQNFLSGVWTSDTSNDITMQLTNNIDEQTLETTPVLYEFTELPKTLFALIGVMIMLVGGLMVMRD